MGLLDRLFPPLSPQRFARKILRSLKSAGRAEATLMRDEFGITVSPDGYRLFLDNLYREYVVAPWRQRGAVLRRCIEFARSSRESPDDEPELHECRENLLPRIRERFYHQAIRLQFALQGASEADLPTLDFSDDLTVELVIDQPQAIQVVHGSLLRKWGMSLEEALKVARDNLWRQSNQNFVEISPGLYRSPWQDTHDASRLYLHDLIWQLPVHGEHVAMVPNRDVLLVTGSEHVEGLLAMAAVAEEVLRSPRPMSGFPVRLDGSRWTAYLPPAGDPAHWPLRKVSMTAMATQYAEQQALLDKYHEAKGFDVFVASHVLIERKVDGTWFTWTSWLDGITDALIPKADFIVFGRVPENTRLGTAGWDRVAAAAGELMEDVEMYPPRYRLRQFPSPDQLSQMDLRSEFDPDDAQPIE